MKLFSFTVSPAKPWLMLPVDNAGKKVDVAITCGDTVIKSFDMKLANGKAADWFTPIPVGAFSGKTLTVSINDDNAVHTQYCYCAATPWPKDIYKESLRPRLRFSPALGWTNDPNGLVFYKGEYHLFFQHNPYGTDWGNMTWGHAVSKDLLHWKELGDALHPDKFGTMFSGSAVVDVNNTSGFGTEQNPPMVLIYTAAGKPFTQCIAYSLNGRTFTKFDGNPVVPNQTDGNRDPKVYWNDKTQLWTMLFYVGHPNQVHTVEFWTSPNLKEWTKVSVYPGDCNGITGGIKAVDGKAVGMFRSPCLLGLGPQGGRKQEGGYCCECAPASIPQAASMSSPLEALIVHTIPWLFNRFLNSSIRISGAHS